VKKNLISVLRFVFVGYFLILLTFMFFENHLVYPAPQYPAGDWEASWLDPQDVFFESADGTRLHGWLVEHPDPNGYLLLCHGNATNVAFSAGEIAELRDRLGVTVFAFDYRGYGRSEGTPNESGILADGQAAFDWLQKHAGVGSDEIIVMGRSLGGGVAVDLAARNSPRVLILDRTFSSLPDVAAWHYPWLPVRWLMKNRMASIEKIDEYDGPLFQFHGRSDKVVPFDLGKALFDASPSATKQFTESPRCGHNDPFPPEIWERLLGFLQTI